MDKIIVTKKLPLEFDHLGISKNEINESDFRKTIPKDYVSATIEPQITVTGTDLFVTYTFEKMKNKPEGFEPFQYGTRK